MSCAALAGKKKNRPCRNVGHPLLLGIGIERCEVHGRIEGLLSGEPAALTHTALHGGAQVERGEGAGGAPPEGGPVSPSPILPDAEPAPAQPESEPAPEPEAEPPAELAAFPAAPPIEAEPGAAKDAAPPADHLDALERMAAGVFRRDVPDDPAAADAAAIEAAEAGGAGGGIGALADVTAGGTWTLDRSERLTRFLCGALFRRTGKEPLDDDELREGAEAMMPVWEDLFKNPSTPRYLPAIIWAAVVFGTRYGGDVKRAVSARRAARSAPRVQTPPVALSSEDDEPPAQPARGWAAAPARAAS